MKKVELLAPAGSFDALKAAVSSGADAIYLGGMRFGARAFANNFDEDEMKEAVSYCHIRGVKVFVTVNTLVYEEELEAAKNYIGFLYEIGVDALIVQDFGIFEMVRETYPDFEIHCSTQMHIHNPDGVQFMKNQGVGRVVLARETPLEVIKKCTNLGVDTEVFVHGALCICYSGQCLFSSLNGGRSGNRGECAQPCRMKYQLKNLDTNEVIDTFGDYLLSPQDLFTLDHVSELIEAGISSFKIEGRMKRPEYVAETVRIYREAIDAYYQNEKIDLEKETNNLKKLFNRGFTQGHLFHAKGKALMNPVRPNHIGIELGTVLKNEKGKLTLKLSHALNQGDGIRILSNEMDDGLLVNRLVKNGLLVNHADCGEIVELEISKRIYCNKNDKVVLTTDSKENEKILDNIKPYYKRIQLNAEFIGRVGEPIQFTLNDGFHTVTATSEEIASKALKKAVEEDKILQQLNKINDTVYEYKNITILSDSDLFISLKSINEVRRLAISMMDDARSKKVRTKIDYPNLNYEPFSVWDKDLIVEDLKHYRMSFNSNESYPIGYRSIETTQKLEGPYVMHKQLGTLNNSKNDQIWIADSSFNCCNSYAIRFLKQCGVDAIVASIEATNEDIESMIEAYKKRYNDTPVIGKFISGHRELMIMKHCIVNTALKDGQRVNCDLCQKNQYALINEKGSKFLITRDSLCHSILLEEKKMNDDSSIKGLSFKVVVKH